MAQTTIYILLFIRKSAVVLYWLASVLSVVEN